MKVTKPTWVNHEGLPIFAVDIHPDGTKFVTGGQGQNTSGRVLIWSLAPVLDEAKSKEENAPKLLCELEFHACVNAVRWSYSGSYLCSAGDDRLVEIWKCSQRYNGASVQSTNNPFAKASHEQWRSVASLSGHTGDVLDVSWSPSDRYLASASVDNNVIVWDALNFPHKVATLTGHCSLVKGVTWDPIGKFIASQSDDRTLRIWRTSDWTIEQVIKDPFTECGGTTHVLRLDWSPDGMYLVSAHAMNGGGPTAQIVERTGWKTDKDFVGHRKAVVCVRFNRNILQREGNKSKTCFVALGSRDRSVSVWSAALKRPLMVMRDLFKHTIMDMSWSQCGTILACCSFDGTVGVIQFTKAEIGKPLSATEVATLHQQTYGSNILFQQKSVSVIQDVAILKGQQRREQAKSEAAKAAQKTEVIAVNGSSELKSKEKVSNQVVKVETTSTSFETPLRSEKNLDCDTASNKSSAGASTPGVSPSKSPGRSSVHASKQIETVRNDGKRRITPQLLIPQDGSSSRDGNNIQSLGVPLISKPEKKTENEFKSGDEQGPRVNEEEQVNGDKQEINGRVALLEARVGEPAGTMAQGDDSQEAFKSKARRSSTVGSDEDPGLRDGTKANTSEPPGGAASKRKRSVDEAVSVDNKSVKKGRLNLPAASSSGSMPAPAHKLPASLIKSNKDKHSSSYTPSVSQTAVNDATVSDSVGTPTKAAMRSKLSPMKLDSNFIQVPIKSKGGYSITVENRKKSGRYITNNITCQHEKDSCNGLNWTVCVDAPVVGMVGDPGKIIILCEDCFCHVLDTKGRYTLPPFVISNFPHKLVLRDQYLMVITVKATLHMWNIYQKKNIIRSESLAPLLQQNLNESRSKAIEISRCTVLVGGIPLLILSNGKSYKFSFDMQTWLLFMGIGPNIPIELDSSDGLLSSRLSICNGSQEVNFAAISDCKRKLACAIDLKRDADIRVCMHSLGLVIAREGLDAELRELFTDLLGPCHSAASASLSLPNSWVPHVQGVPKREMLRSILNDIVKDLRWQDLYCEFNELLESVEVQVNGMET